MRTWDEMAAAAAKVYEAIMEAPSIVENGVTVIEIPPDSYVANEMLRAALADAPLFVVDLMVGRHRVLGRTTTRLLPGRYLLVPIPNEISEEA
jgi:2-keto-3-deoxy-6-phosphogluconate aldolase